MGNTPPPYDFTWAFVVHEQYGKSAQLQVRGQYHFRRWWAPLLVGSVELSSFVMSRKMLLGIKRPAEVHSQPAVAAAIGQ
jgi:hypothetical protein